MHGCDEPQQPTYLQNYEGVKGPIRKAVTEVSREAYEQFLRGDAKAIPAWMQIQDTDGPKAREKKSRALKAFKKRLRCDLTAFCNPNYTRQYRQSVQVFALRLSLLHPCGGILLP